MLKLKELPEILNADHIAEYLQISRYYAYELRKRGLLKGLKIGGVFRFKK